MRDAELRAPAEQQPGDDAVLAGDFSARKLGFLRDRELLLVAEEAPNRCRWRGRIADFRGCQAAFGG